MDIPVKKTLILDPLPLATRVEDEMRLYIVPAESGLYLRGSKKPAIIPGNRYFCKSKNQEKSNRLVAIYDVSDITGDVYNEFGEIVLPFRKKEFVSNEPLVPVRGLNIVYNYVEKVLNDRSEWVRSRRIHDLKSYLSEFIKPEYQEAADIYDHIHELLIDLRIDVNQFVGDDKWVMHFCKFVGNDICVEKTIDYRVYSWSREHFLELGSDYKL
jgi:hypothetical protein